MVRNLHYGNYTLWPHFVGFKSPSSGIMLLGKGRRWERIEKKEAARAETWSLVQKDSFFQIMYKNRMDVGGERTARKKQCCKRRYLANVSPP